MPTVLREKGFEVMIYTQDHEPAHIHIWKAGREVVVDLRKGAAPPIIRRVHGMSKNQVREAYHLVERHLEHLRRKWRKLHG